MSVIQYDQEFFDHLYSDLLYAKGSYQEFFSLTYREKLEAKLEQIDEENERRKILEWWLTRLYIANQMAHAFEYQSMRGESKENAAKFLKMFSGLGYEVQEASRGESPYLYFFPQPRPFTKKLPRNPYKTCADLRMLHYNLVANSGARFVSKDDEERLESVISEMESHFANVHDKARELEKTVPQKNHA